MAADNGPSLPKTGVLNDALEGADGLKSEPYALEGQLLLRGTSKVGKWESLWFRLDEHMLSAYALDDSDCLGARLEITLKNITDLTARDDRMQEFAFRALGAKTRLRAPQAAEGKRWFETLKLYVAAAVASARQDSALSRRTSQASIAETSPAPQEEEQPAEQTPRTDLWLQIDRITGLPRQTNASYVIQSRWRGAQEGVQTERRPGQSGLGAASDAFEECIIRQQVLLKHASMSPDGVVEVTILRLFDGQGDEVIGRISLPTLEVGQSKSKAKDHVILDGSGLPTGAMAKMRIKRVPAPNNPDPSRSSTKAVDHSPAPVSARTGARSQRSSVSSTTREPPSLGTSATLASPPASSPASPAPRNAQTSPPATQPSARSALSRRGSENTLTETKSMTRTTRVNSQPSFASDRSVAREASGGESRPAAASPPTGHVVSRSRSGSLQTVGGGSASRARSEGARSLVSRQPTDGGTDARSEVQRTESVGTMAAEYSLVDDVRARGRSPQYAPSASSSTLQSSYTRMDTVEQPTAKPNRSVTRSGLIFQNDRTLPGFEAPEEFEVLDDVAPAPAPRRDSRPSAAAPPPEVAPPREQPVVREASAQAALQASASAPGRATGFQAAQASASAPPRPASARGAGSYAAQRSARQSVPQRPDLPKSEVKPEDGLEALMQLLDYHHLRISDLFRSSHYNPSYHLKGDELLTPGELKMVLGKAGLEISAPDARAIVAHLDDNGDGMIDIEELETALRAHKRGSEVWLEEGFPSGRQRFSFSPQGRGGSPRSRSPGSPRRFTSEVIPERLLELHKLHDERLFRLEQKQQHYRLREIQAIEEAAKKAFPLRASIAAQEVDLDELSNRLYNDHKAFEMRKKLLKQKYDAMKEKDLEVGRAKPALDGPAKKEAVEQVTERLLTWKEKVNQKREKEKETVLANELSELDKIGVTGAKRISSTTGEGKEHIAIAQMTERLFGEATKRRLHLEKKRESALVQETKDIKAHMIGADKKSIEPARWEAWHREHQKRLEAKRRALEAKEKDERSQVEQATQHRRELRAKALEQFRNTSSRFQESKPRSPSPQERSKEEKPSKKWSLFEPVEHMLRLTSSIISTRCGAALEENRQKEVADLGIDLKKALEEYRKAAQKSDNEGDGTAYLKQKKSMRLYNDGVLMEDDEGFAKCCKPDSIRQIEDDIDSLMALSEEAQALLMKSVMSDSGNLDHIMIRWPVGHTYKNTFPGLRAQYAYNPGPKTREAAIEKAMVLYGATDGNLCCRHILDVARISLVYNNSVLLRAGLEFLIARYEVVDVRNHYQPGMQSLLGDRFVEVLVVVKTGLPVPMVCEIRLEEECFFNARQKAGEHLEKVCEGFQDIYKRPCNEEGAIRYLAQWVLRRPKESHSMTVFRRQLARKFGSTIGVWRKFSPSSGKLSFQGFRDLCFSMNYRERTVEYWLALDVGRAGLVSIFDFDQDAVLLLAKFYARLYANYKEYFEEDAETLWIKILYKARIRLARPGHMDAHEFRLVFKQLGFSAGECDRLFAYLDANGGMQAPPPASICVADLAWFKRLPNLISIAGATVCKDGLVWSGASSPALALPADVEVELLSWSEQSCLVSKTASASTALRRHLTSSFEEAETPSPSPPLAGQRFGIEHLQGFSAEKLINPQGTRALADKARTRSGSALGDGSTGGLITASADDGGQADVGSELAARSQLLAAQAEEAPEPLVQASASQRRNAGIFDDEDEDEEVEASEDEGNDEEAASDEDEYNEVVPEEGAVVAEAGGAVPDPFGDDDDETF